MASSAVFMAALGLAAQEAQRVIHLSDGRIVG
jgi:hypothetical protein